MDIQAFNLNSKVVFTVFYAWCLIGFSSCSSEEEKNGQPEVQLDLTAIRERMKVTELAYEYEQFVNKMWLELNVLSDEITEFSTGDELQAPVSRRQKMASIENKLRKLDVKLKEAEGKMATNEANLQAIRDLRDAIKRKDDAIAKLKKENRDLRDEIGVLMGQLETKRTQLELKNLELNEKERQLLFQKSSSARELEIMGDYLRKIVKAMGGYKGSGVYESYKAGQMKLLETSIYCYEQANKIYPAKVFRDKMQRTRIAMEKYSDSRDLSWLDF